MDLSLPARAKELQARARAFCEEVLLPLELTVDEAGELPEAERPGLRQAVRDWGFRHLFINGLKLAADMSLDILI